MHLSKQKKGLVNSQMGQGKLPGPRCIEIKPGVQGPSQYHPKNTETKGTEAGKAAFESAKGCVGELLQQTHRARNVMGISQCEETEPLGVF